MLSPKKKKMGIVNMWGHGYVAQKDESFCLAGS